MSVMIVVGESLEVNIIYGVNFLNCREIVYNVYSHVLYTIVSFNGGSTVLRQNP